MAKKPVSPEPQSAVRSHTIGKWTEIVLLLIVWTMLTWALVRAWKSKGRFQKVKAMIYAKKLFALDEDMCDPDAKNGACLTVIYGIKPDKAFLRVRDDPKVFALKNDIVVYINKDKPTKALLEKDVDKHMSSLKWMMAMWILIDLLVLVVIVCRIFCLFH
jgi:hypothetical protein